MTKRKMLKGGSLSPDVIQGLLKKSYEKKPSSFQGYQIDKSLSGERVQVYYNPALRQAVVVHRGSAGAKDWLVNDAGLLVGYRGDRFSHAQDIQNKAEKKYGAKNVTTLGHSLGAKIAEEVGQNSKEIITLNKPTVDAKKVSGKQYDIRTSSDLVSGLSGIASSKNKTTIPSGFRNPISEHSTDVLSRLKNKPIGKGRRGGKVPDPERPFITSEQARAISSQRERERLERERLEAIREQAREEARIQAEIDAEMAQWFPAITLAPIQNPANMPQRAIRQRNIGAPPPPRGTGRLGGIRPTLHPPDPAEVEAVLATRAAALIEIRQTLENRFNEIMDSNTNVNIRLSRLITYIQYWIEGNLIAAERPPFEALIEHIRDVYDNTLSSDNEENDGQPPTKKPRGGRTNALPIIPRVQRMLIRLIFRHNRIQQIPDIRERRDQLDILIEEWTTYIENLPDDEPLLDAFNEALDDYSDELVDLGEQIDAQNQAQQGGAIINPRSIVPDLMTDEDREQMAIRRIEERRRRQFLQMSIETYNMLITLDDNETRIRILLQLLENVRTENEVMGGMETFIYTMENTLEDFQSQQLYGDDNDPEGGGVGNIFRRRGQIHPTDIYDDISEDSNLEPEEGKGDEFEDINFEAQGVGAGRADCYSQCHHCGCDSFRDFNTLHSTEGGGTGSSSQVAPAPAPVEDPPLGENPNERRRQTSSNLKRGQRVRKAEWFNKVIIPKFRKLYRRNAKLEFLNQSYEKQGKSTVALQEEYNKNMTILTQIENTFGLPSTDDLETYKSNLTALERLARGLPILDDVDSNELNINQVGDIQFL